MTDERNVCTQCRGDIERTTTTFYHEEAGQRWIFEHVPAFVCERCGATSFPPDATEAMERIILGTVQPEREALVPIYDLAQPGTKPVARVAAAG